MATYLMSDGREYTIWVAEVHAYHLSKRITIKTRYVFRVSAVSHDEEIPATVAMRHVRSHALPCAPDRIREATGAEISWYFRQHPSFVHRSCTDARFVKFQATS